MAGRLIDTAQELSPDELVLAIVDGEQSPPWRRGAELVSAFVLFAVLWQLPLARPWSIIVYALGLALHSLIPARRILSRTSERVRVIRPTTLLRPDRSASIVDEAPPGGIERIQGGILSDRWQVGDTSILVRRSQRRQLDGWRTVDTS